MDKSDNQGLPLESTTMEDLFLRAARAREAAYAPFSNFKVGAAILASDGQIFEGCNVENSSYGLTVCAERVAVFHGVAHGQRTFAALAVVCEDDSSCTPCGACLQVLQEFAPGIAILTGSYTSPKVFSLAELLPHPFAWKPEAGEAT